MAPISATTVSTGSSTWMGTRTIFPAPTGPATPHTPISPCHPRRVSVAAQCRTPRLCGRGLSELSGSRVQQDGWVLVHANRSSGQLRNVSERRHPCRRQCVGGPTNPHVRIWCHVVSSAEEEGAAMSRSNDKNDALRHAHLSEEAHRQKLRDEAFQEAGGVDDAGSQDEQRKEGRGHI
jgi:hypothetical protein